MALSTLHLTSATIAPPPSKHAAISLLTSPTPGLRVTVGAPTKYAGNPLFVQDQPWESRIDNGYPNVAQPADGRGYQLWYGNGAFDGSRHRTTLLYANSTDGIHWEKPALGLFDFNKANMPPFADLGTQNNVIVEGDGIGVYRDPYDADPSRRYKAFGLGCWLSPTLSFQGADGACGDLYEPAPLPPGVEQPVAEPLVRQFHGYIASSADGLTWPPKTHVSNISWPPPQKWDTHNNVFFDERSQSYVATTRDIPIETTGVERETSLTFSMGKEFAFNTTAPPPVIVRGSQAHQTYAQVTFPWLNMYLGFSMVFDSETEFGAVHCRLVSAPAPQGPWKAVGADSGSVLDAPDFLPLGAAGAFDSHVIFAAASPFAKATPLSGVESAPDGDDDLQWIYYMGGNGPHSGERNSSFGLATLRADGYAGVRGHGVFRTPSLVVTDAMLTATADFVGRGSALRVGVVPDGSDGKPPLELSIKNSMPLTSNATDAPMRFTGDCKGGLDLTAWLGKTIQLDVSLEGDAILYTIGFAPREATSSSAGC